MGKLLVHQPKQLTVFEHSNKHKNERNINVRFRDTTTLDVFPSVTEIVGGSDHFESGTKP